VSDGSINVNHFNSRNSQSAITNLCSRLLFVRCGCRSSKRHRAGGRSKTRLVAAKCHDATNSAECLAFRRRQRIRQRLLLLRRIRGRRRRLRPSAFGARRRQQQQQIIIIANRRPRSRQRRPTRQTGATVVATGMAVRRRFVGRTSRVEIAYRRRRWNFWTSSQRHFVVVGRHHRSAIHRLDGHHRVLASRRRRRADHPDRIEDLPPRRRWRLRRQTVSIRDAEERRTAAVPLPFRRRKTSGKRGADDDGSCTSGSTVDDPAADADAAAAAVSVTCRSIVPTAAAAAAADAVASARPDCRRTTVAGCRRPVAVAAQAAAAAADTRGADDETAMSAGRADMSLTALSAADGAVELVRRSTRVATRR
jgi:hypothetical protein